ncbi:hypothetical protein HDU84_005458 [Entophlyctis sp. JEL0112]|nr:hypothetical protein HDU84_005458 [Entophlyctis sp. JEL0112]
MLDRTPVEVVFSIFSFCDLVSIARCALVSKSLRAHVSALPSSLFPAIADRFGDRSDMNETVADIAIAVAQSVVPVRHGTLPQSPDWSGVPRIAIPHSVAPSPLAPGQVRRWIAIDYCEVPDDDYETILLHWTSEEIPLIYVGGRLDQFFIVIDARTGIKIGTFPFSEYTVPITKSDFVVEKHRNFNHCNISLINPHNGTVSEFKGPIDSFAHNAALVCGYGETLFFVSPCTQATEDQRRFEVASYSISASKGTMQMKWKTYVTSDDDDDLEAEVIEPTEGHSNGKVLIFGERDEFFVYNFYIICAKSGQLLRKVCPFPITRYHILDVCLTRFHLILSWNETVALELESLEVVGPICPFGLSPYEIEKELRSRRMVSSVDGQALLSSAVIPNESESEDHWTRKYKLQAKVSGNFMGMIASGTPVLYETEDFESGYWVVYEDLQDGIWKRKVEFIVGN